MNFRTFIALLGNILEHYSSAIFNLSIPFLMPLFFPNETWHAQLIKAFILIPLTFVTKPLGASYFSYLAIKKNQELSLKLSYLGMASTCLCLGFIPSGLSTKAIYSTLVIIRLCQGFFSSGETINGAIYVIKESKVSNRGFMSGLFDASSIAGYFIAALALFLFQKHDLFSSHWRVLFLLGILPVIPAILLKKPNLLEIETLKGPINRGLLFQVGLISGISYAFFHICFVFTNAASSLFCTFEQEKISKQTTILLVIDMILLPSFGFLTKKIKSQNLMKLALGLSFVIVPAGFSLASKCTLHEFFLLRLSFTILGALFSANLFQFFHERLPFTNQRVALSLSASLGAALIGQSFPLFATSLHKIFPSPFTLGLFFSFLCLLGFTTLQKNSKNDSEIGLKKKLRSPNI